MKKQDYHTNITVNATAHEAFECINNVSKWWTENWEGSSQKLNDEFTVRFGETFVSVKIVELVPGRKIVWHVTDCNKPWLKNKKEWKDTKISFEIFQTDNQPDSKRTQISFTHLGLIPEIECFEVCSNAWSEYIQGSLLNFVNTGKGQPTRKEGKQSAKAK